MLKLALRLRVRLRRLSLDTRGVAAVEFVLMLPLMLMIFFGTIQVSTVVAVDRKVSLVARSLSDMISQAPALGVADADFTNAFNITQAIMYPYANTPVQAIISEVRIDPTTLVGTVMWSKALNATAHAQDSVVSVPTGLQTGGAYLNLSEVTYNYQPVVGYNISLGFTSASFALSDSMFTRPRQNNCVIYPASTTTTACPTS
jgi:Flp pilus assembly protein TadG